jgi:hypothetical protein
MRSVRPITTWTAWWLGLAALWLLYQGERNDIQLYAALSAGALGATLMLVIRIYARTAARVELRWLGGVLRLPWRVVYEFVLVTSLLVRALARREIPTGEFRAVPFPMGAFAGAAGRSVENGTQRVGG